MFCGILPGHKLCGALPDLNCSDILPSHIFSGIRPGHKLSGLPGPKPSGDNFLAFCLDTNIIMVFCLVPNFLALYLVTD